MPCAVTLTLDDEFVRRLDRLAAERGLERPAVLDHLLRLALELEDKARSAEETLLAAAREGDQTSGPGLAALHDDIRLWLLSWGSDDERKRPRSC